MANGEDSALETPGTTYVLGRSAHERERLRLQARVLRPYTERFFRAAGLAPGMRVLDLGSGVGDVALLAAELVGPGGRVLGIDRDTAALAEARRRALESGVAARVSFEAVGAENFSVTRRFDALVGRYVLLYQSDPAAVLRRLLRAVEPGGVVVFHEFAFAAAPSTYPVCTLYEDVTALIREAFRRAGLPLDFGRRLARTFLDAGLPYPTLAAELPVGGGQGSPLYAWIAATLASVSPRFTELGITAPPGLVIDAGLAARLEEAVVARGSQITGSAQIGAWTRAPA